MALALQDLPIEVFHLTLQFLPIPDLLTFARTSKRNYSLSKRVLKTLDLAIFPRRIHSLLAFFDTSNEDEDQDEDEDEDEDDSQVSNYWTRRHRSFDEPLCRIGLVTPQSNRPSLSRSITPPSPTAILQRQHQALNQDPIPSSSSTPMPTPNLPTLSMPTSRPPSQPRTRPTPLTLRTHEITTQNTIANKVLQTPALNNIQTLTLHLYDLSSPTLTHTLAQFSNLTSLTLDLCHPYIHDTTFPAKYWRETPISGSPIWNSLAGVGDAQDRDLRLRNLKYLNVNRSGITSFQLRSWIQRNPNLRELRLALCRGVDSEFVNWFSTHIASVITSTSTPPYITSRSQDHTKPNFDKVRFIDCSALHLSQEHDFKWVDNLVASGLSELSFSGCRNVNEDILLELAKAWVGKSPFPLSIVSTKDVVIRKRREIDAEWALRVSGGKGKAHERGRGSVSPALTIGGDTESANGLCSLAKIEVDLEMLEMLAL